jgi:hypothetical protein
VRARSFSTTSNTQQGGKTRTAAISNRRSSCRGERAY